MVGQKEGEVVLMMVGKKNQEKRGVEGQKTPNNPSALKK